MSDYHLQFIAAFISDGKLRWSGAPWKSKARDVEFEVSRERKISMLRSLSPNHEYRQAKAYGLLTKTPLTVFRFKYPEFFDGVFAAYKVLSRDFINGLSARQAQVFLSAYTIFDGNGDTESVTLYTSSPEMRDDLVTISVLAGHHPSVQRGGFSILTKRDSWRIIFHTQKKTRTISKSHITRRRFVGKLYCVRVPDGRIVVRGGPLSSPVVTGNCGAFMAFCFDAAGVAYPKEYASAKAWLNWGTPLVLPIYGCVVVFSREGGGHVGLVVGTDGKGRLMVLGGNQRDGVCILPFDQARVTGYRAPPGIETKPLPIIASNATSSTNEA